MIDLSGTIVPNSDQLNADDLIVGPKTITVTGVKVKPGDQPTSINYEGDDGKPYKPCKSMMRVLVSMWGKDGNDYIGRSMTLFCEPSVTFGPNKVGGIRISHMSHIEKPMTMALTVSRSRRTPYTVEPLASGGGGELESLGVDAARSGTTTLRAFWENLSIEQKKQMESKLDGWKKIASNVDGGK